MRIALIIRPRAGRAELEEIRGWVAELRGAGHEVWPRLTFESGDARREAATLADQGAELVVAVGGDGTVNGVANGILDAGPGSGPHSHSHPGGGPRGRARLGVVPVGTANDFAVGLGLPGDARAALEVAVTGVPRRVDAGRVNGRWFVNVSTGGFGAEASEEAPEEAKRLLGPLAYVVTGVRLFSDLAASRARFTLPDGVAYDGELLLFAVGNAKRTGGGNLITPRAELDDGWLDVVIVPGMPRLEFLALLPAVRSGDHLDDPSVRYFRASRVVVEAEADLSVNADGEPVRGRRFEYDVAPGALEVMTPKPE